MYGIEFQEPFKMISERSVLQDVSGLENVDILPRNIMELSSSIGTGKNETGLKDDFSTGFSMEQARAEADRCLRCGLVCYEKSRPGSR
jgi:hypothetical protein